MAAKSWYGDAPPGIDARHLRGALIVLEGSDGAGLSTHTELLAEWLEQLRRLHGLDDGDRRILLGAALLHDIGQFVAYRDHHKHSLELILRSRLPAFSTGELPLVALVARYHRGASPRGDHPVWSAIDDRDRHRVARMAALLRMADVLDRDHAQAVRSARAALRKGTLLVELTHDGARPDLSAVSKKSAMLESELGVRVVVRACGAGVRPGAR
jgi:exopolyphosphatase / guanosine-5'-triphosphate,3'-diphosphate pyrophosphatase